MYQNDKDVSLCTNAKTAQAAIPEALDDLENAEKRLHDVLDHLGARLGAVLSPEAAEASKDGAGQPHASELHGRLVADVYRVTTAAMRVERILSRLTL